MPRVRALCSALCVARQLKRSAADEAVAQQSQATFGLAFLAVLPIVTFAALQLSGCELLPQPQLRACSAKFADMFRSRSMATVRAIEAARSTGSFSAASFFAMLANGVAW